MPRPLVILNAIPTGGDATARANRIVNGAVELINSGGNARAINIVSVCMEKHGKSSEPYPAIIKKNEIIQLHNDGIGPVAYVINVKVEPDGSSLNRGIFVEHKDERKAFSNAVRLHSIAHKVWAKRPVYIYQYKAFLENELPPAATKASADLKIYNVEGNQASHDLALRIARPLKRLATEIGDILNAQVSGGFLSESAKNNAMGALLNALSRYKRGGSDSRLSVIVLEAVRSEAGKLKVEWKIEHLAKQYGWWSLLFIRPASTGAYLPALTYGAGSLANSNERLVLASEPGIQNHSQVLAEFVAAVQPKN
ncbi:MAG: hypothetical protein QW568_04885 [Candidatus Anstonellaceae archaeon]